MRGGNVATKSVKMYQGEELGVDVDGGFSRKTLDEDGYLVTDRSGYEMFVPANLSVSDPNSKATMKFESKKRKRKR